MYVYDYYLSVENCNWDEEIRATSNLQLTSPNYPQVYPNNAYCRTVVSAQPGFFVKVEINDFVTESCCDYLTVSHSCSLISRLCSMISFALSLFLHYKRAIQ